MPKFQLREATSGGEVGEPFEAKNREEALEIYLEEHGETLTEEKEEVDEDYDD